MSTIRRIGTRMGLLLDGTSFFPETRATDAPAAKGPASSRRLAFRIKVALAVCLWVVLIAELAARHYLGLGTPPLSVAHPRIEYMFKPNQDVRRFGNRVLINQYGMRSETFAIRRQEGEVRIMAFGDSVLNGGALTDHRDMATTLLQERLKSKGFSTPVVGSISAGSWGPGNWLAYVREYGLFDADIVVLVASSHDYDDNPTFEPLNPLTHPTERPRHAHAEGNESYLPRYIPWLAKHDQHERSSFVHEAANPADAKGLKDLRAFIRLARQTARQVIVVQHLELEELEKKQPHPGFGHIRQIAEQEGATVLDTAKTFSAALARGENPYRDNIHPNQLGQKLLAELLEGALSYDVLWTAQLESAKGPEHQPVRTAVHGLARRS